MRWDELFERAEAYDVTGADVQEALKARRGSEGPGGADGER